MSLEEMLSTLVTQSTCVPMVPAEGVVQVMTHEWVLPSAPTLASDWASKKRPFDIKSPTFTGFGVQWNLRFCKRDGENQFGLFLHRENKWDRTNQRINWAVFIGADRIPYVSLREFAMNDMAPTDNWGQSGFLLKGAVKRAAKDGALLVTIVLQRATTDHPAATLRHDLASQLDHPETSDLSILCQPTRKPKPDAKSDGSTPPATKKPKYNPTGCNPTSVGCNPTSVGCNPTSVGCNPTSVGCNPTAVGCNPTAVGCNPTSVGCNPTTGAGGGLEEEEEQGAVRANRFVMALRSPVVHGMFYGPAKGREASEGVWDLRPYSRSVVQALVQYSYGVDETVWSVSIGTAADAATLFELSMRLQLLDLSRASVRLFANRPNDVATASSAFRFAKPFLDLLHPTPPPAPEPQTKVKPLTVEETLTQVGRTVYAPWTNGNYYQAVVTDTDPFNRVASVRFVADNKTANVLFRRLKAVLPRKSDGSSSSSSDDEAVAEEAADPDLVAAMYKPSYSQVSAKPETPSLVAAQAECARQITNEARKFLIKNIDYLVFQLPLDS